MASIPLVFLVQFAWFVPAQEAPAGRPIVVRVEGSAQALRSGDFDGDGRTDLALVNNGRARIELLLQRGLPPEGAPAPKEPERNVPADDPVFERRTLLTERQVGGFVAADLDGDSRTDLAWYGDPKGLVVAFQGEKGTFEHRREFAIDDGSDGIHAMQAGDVDGDGRTDLVLLAERDIVIVRQGAEGLRDPVRFPAARPKASYVRLGDFDGDRRLDFLFADNNDERPIRLRFQQADGGLGPEIAFRTPPARSIKVLPEDPGHGFLLIPQASGTLRRARFARAEKEVLLGAARFLPTGARGGEKSVAAAGDIDGDGRTDVAVTDPGGARLLVWTQTAPGVLTGPAEFPSYKELSGVRLADLDGDGRAEAVVHSKEEKALGVQRWDGKRFLFPEAVPVEGVPQAVLAADLDGDGKTDVVAAVKDKKAARLWMRKGGEAATLELQPASEVEGLRAADLDGDGRVDLAVLVPFEAPRFLRGSASGFEEVPAATLSRKVSLQGLTEAGTSVADLDADGRPELLVAREGFARAAALDPDGAARILDQVNGPAGAKLAAAAVVDLDGSGAAEVVLLDPPSKSVRVMVRSATGTYSEAVRIDLGEGDFKSLLLADLTGDGRKDVVAAGPGRLALMPASARDLEIVEDVSYESPERDAHLTHLAPGAGGEIVAVDTGNHAIEILRRSDAGWKRERSWKVFESKTFSRAGGGDGQEPHDLLLADVTGDGQPEICLLCHDRVVIY